MKTLREVLFEKHQAAEPRLDAIREQVVAGLNPDGSTEAPVRSKRAAGDWQSGAPGWRQFLWSLRWHLAGVSAIWMVALLLNVDSTPELTQDAPRQEAPSPQQFLAGLRESQRQLRELTEAPAAQPAPEAPEPKPSPRSQIQSRSTAAV
jgi:hypothetical protein